MKQKLVASWLIAPAFTLLRVMAMWAAIAWLSLLAGCGGSTGDGGSNNQPLADNEVMTAQGRLAGKLENNLRIFRGVRYAAPLTAGQRFRPPQELAPFTDTYDATQVGSPCAQPYLDGIIGAEDCLFLNIWAHADNTRRPVMVYMHGGASGGVSGSSARIDGATFAARTGVVVVTVNRRLGVLGNLALNELVAEHPASTAGNYEVLDAIQALKWVQQNIAGFNGDPNRVLLAGDSFGGRLICHILAAPAAAGLFQSLAIQSGACGERTVLRFGLGIFTRYPPALYAQRQIVAETGCDMVADVLACMRQLPVEQLILAGMRIIAMEEDRRDLFGPTIDGVVVETDPHTALQNNLVGDIPLIAGATRDEMGVFYQNTEVPDDAAYKSLLTKAFPAPLDAEIYAIYPTADFATPKEAFLTAIGDVVVNCVAEELAHSAAGSAPSYLYLVSRGFDSGLDAGKGATHSVDITYLFESFAARQYTPDTQALAIAAAMQSGWSNLAADPTRAPAVNASIDWPRYEPVTKSHIDFGESVEAANDYRNSRCDQLRAVLPL